MEIRQKANVKTLFLNRTIPLTTLFPSKASGLKILKKPLWKSYGVTTNK